MPDEPDKQAVGVIALFTEFLKAYARATPKEQAAFLDFINPQTRQDIINLAEALKAREAR